MWICEYAAKKERICNVMCYATILLYKPAVCMNWRQASERERERSEEQIYDKFSLPYFITFIFMQKDKKHTYFEFLFA